MTKPRGVPGQGLVFGGAAELYDRRRPSYPGGAVDHILSTAPGAADVLDIGCGTGKAAVLFAARGLRVTGLEPDPDMAAVAQRNLPSSRIVTSRFEAWDGAADQFDIAVSAQAWHWVDRADGIPKAAHVLRPGRVLALMANVPRGPGVEPRDVVEPVYEAIVPGLVKASGMLNWTGQFEGFAAELSASGRFDLLAGFEQDWDQVVDAEGFGELTQTHSDYRIIDDATRARLVQGLVEAIDAAGGSVTMLYRTVVLAARLRAVS